MKYTVKYKKIRDNALIPAKAHKDDAGFDLSVSSIIPNDDGTITYGCGLAFDFSEVGWADARPRSSVVKHGLLLSNSCGVIDAGYRGEITGVFYVMDEHKPIYTYGERFIQLVFPALKPEDEIEFIEVDELDSTERGTGGYGSTGDKS